ncbi:Chloroperoxidase [Lentinula edodes]|uniref:Chloroperoxidase n=1 Tax=Lentinula edodes TaxID=5353 RepID=UPI001E8DAC82|nr:Chloroperoxidase [Lentinula edodes]KAH7870350.1 Chloroperoxidase [Lentinula edodes]
MPSDTLTIDNFANSLSASSPIVSATSTVFPLPADHPPMHEHSGGTCPVTGKTHAYCPPQKGDIRSVCPALNTMANHGFIPRDGRNLTFSILFRGLKACYGLSSTLATVLVTGGFLAIGRSPIRIPFISDLSLFRVQNPDGSISPSGVIDLYLIGLHGRVEHDASLVHRNTPDGEKYGPIKIKEEWVPKLVGDIEPRVDGYSPEYSDTDNLDVTPDHKRDPSAVSSSSESSSSSSTKTFINSPEYLSTLVDEADVGRMRARRQHDILPKQLDGLHAEIARGEMSIILGVWNSQYQPKHKGKRNSNGNGEKQGIPLPWLLQWLSEERLPEVPVSSSNTEAETEVSDGTTTPSKSQKTTMWRPNHKQTLRDVVSRSQRIRKVAEAAESQAAKL